MSLPNLPYGDKLRREVRTEWGGLNLNESAGDGELIEAMNMSSREFPLLATSYGRTEVHSCDRLKAFFIAEKTGNAYRYLSVEKYGEGWGLYSGSGLVSTYVGAVSGADNTQMVQMQDKVYIFPDKKVYDVTAGALSDMESSVTIQSGATFTDGTVFGADAQDNTLLALNAGWGDHFREGDAVTISGCRAEENNQTFVIREISGNLLRFYENTFAPGWLTFHIPTGGFAAGTYYLRMRDGRYKYFTLNAAVSLGDADGWGYYRDGDGSAALEWYESGQKVTASTLIYDYSGEGTPSPVLACTLGIQEDSPVTVARTVPNIKRACVSGNRLWGFDGDTIYASKLGDPLNFNVFDGLSTDSWALEVRKQMDFTACVTYRGYPTFFKPDYVVRVLGDEPGNFTLDELEIPGIMDRASGHDGVNTLVVVRNALYYLSVDGVVAWHGSGDYATISEALGIDREWNGAYRAGTDGRRYYLSSGTMGGTVSACWVYDPRFGTWHQEELGACFFDRDHRDFYIAESDKLYKRNSNRKLSNTEEWTVTFADSTRAYKTVLTGSESKKGVLRLLIRCKTAKKMKVWLAYDGGAFEEAAEVGGDKISYIVPLILRRCDFWQLKLTGTGAAVIYSIAVERYGGEWQQAK